MAAHLQLPCMQYSLPDPLFLLNENNLWPRSQWSTLVTTRATVFFENSLRNQAEKNLNVLIQGLSGVPHQAVLNVQTTQDALKLRYHLKFLSGDYLTAERMFMTT